MARVQVDSGFTPPVKTAGVGQVFYLRSGVWVVRNGVAPIQPTSEAQLLERAGFAHGSRQWAYDMSSANKAAWAADPFAGLTGQQSLIASSSCNWETGVVLSPPGAPGAAPECGSQASPTFDPSTETFTWSLLFPDAEMDSEAWIAIQPLFSPGLTVDRRSPTIVTRVPATDGVKDLWPAAVARFGSAIAQASGVAVVMRYSVPADNVCSPP